MDLKDISFDNLPRPVKHAILAGIIVCLAFLFYLYFMKDSIKERDALRADIAKLQTSVSKMAVVESQLAQFEKELAQLEQRLTVLSSILPSEKETPTLLQNIQHMAISSNLKINDFTPKGLITREFYSDWPINIEVEGNYNGLGTFFDKIGRATRLIDVGTISIKSINQSTDPKLTLTATCTATTFIFRENQPDTSGSDSGKKEKKP